jgi:hypothetical protein
MFEEKIWSERLDIDPNHLEQVKSYKYLGPIVNGDNSVEGEIKESLLATKPTMSTIFFFTLSIPVCVCAQIKVKIQVPSSHTNSYVFPQFISGNTTCFG